MRRSRGETLLFALLVLVHLIPVWAFPYFPSQDGPSHLENASILRRYHDPDQGLLRTYYALNPRPDPNWFGHLLLAGLLGLVPPGVAEKLLLSLYVLLLPLSARYALLAVDRGAGFLSVLLFPFTFSWPLHMGFHYFSLSLPVFFFTAGCWLRSLEAPSRGRVATLAVLGLGLYFTHIVSLVMALALIAGFSLWLLAWERLAMRRGPRPLRFRLRLVATATAFFPALALTAVFLADKGWERTSPAPAAELWRRLRHLEALRSFAEGEALLASVIFWMFALLLAWFLREKASRREVSAWDGLLVVSGLYVCIYFIAPPGMAGGGYLLPRLMLFPFFGLILWFGAQPFPAALRQGLMAASAAAALGLLALRLGPYAELSADLREYVSVGERMEPGSVLLPLRYGEGRRRQPLSAPVDVFVHAAGHMAAGKGLVQLANYEANKGHFPILFRAVLNPYTQMGGDLEGEPPCVDLQGYSKRTGRAVDYVLLWRFPKSPAERCGESLLRQLQSGYALIYTSQPRGQARLFRLKERGGNSSALRPWAPATVVYRPPHGRSAVNVPSALRTAGRESPAL